MPHAAAAHIKPLRTAITTRTTTATANSDIIKKLK